MQQLRLRYLQRQAKVSRSSVHILHLFPNRPAEAHTKTMSGTQKSLIAEPRQAFLPQQEISLELSRTCEAETENGLCGFKHYACKKSMQNKAQNEKTTTSQMAHT